MSKSSIGSSESTGKDTTSFNKLCGHPTDIATGDITTLKAIMKQTIVNKHFRQLGVKAYNQQKALLEKLSEITDKINQDQQDNTQKEYKKVFCTTRNGWVS